MIIILTIKYHGSISFPSNENITWKARFLKLVFQNVFKMSGSVECSKNDKTIN